VGRASTHPTVRTAYSLYTDPPTSRLGSRTNDNLSLQCVLQRPPCSSAVLHIAPKRMQISKHLAIHLIVELQR